MIRGGARLEGRVAVSGAKNSALKLAAAALLTEGRTELRNVPAIGDMHAMGAVLGELGVKVAAELERGRYVLEVPADLGTEVPEELGRRLRASIVVLGPLLARCGRVRVAMPGGCNLGHRGIDMHLSGLARMGAEITYGEDFVEARAQRLRGAEIELPFASVGATENLLMAAVTAEGTTRIGNAAREPEIADLAAYLQAMGAHIEGVGTPEMVVHGVGSLAPADHEVVPDRIEAGTYAVAATLTDGAVRLEHVEPAHLTLVLDKLAAAGADLEHHDGPGGRGALTVRGAGRLQAVDVVTLPYPGFPTDLQAQFLVLLSQAAGASMVTENVFDGRFSVIEELRRLGVELNVEGHHVIVRGPTRLRGATVRAPDLRAGAALVLAGLVADGPTVVLDPHHIDRGYADLVGRLQRLGADIAREHVEDPAGAAPATPVPGA